jgi:adenosine deaminase
VDEDIRRFIEGVPKAELHLHIEGTLEPELKFELASRNGITLPYASVAEMRAAYDFHDLPSFLTVYYEGMGVLVREQDFFDLAMAYFRKASAQNVAYAEVFFDPQAHASRGVGFDVVIEGLHRAQGEAEQSLGLRSQLIMCFLRDLSAESAMETLDRSLPFKDWIVGVGLDSDEKDNPPVKFREVFARARSEGYHLTMHCDVHQEDATGHIHQALHDIGVERIDHGVDCLAEEALAEEIARLEMGLTVCPISNRYVTGGLTEKEILEMLDRGIRVTINSDDPAYFNGYVLENLLALQEAAGLTTEQVRQLERNAFSIAWVSDEERQGYLKALEAYPG